METHSSILAWRILQIEEPGGYSSWGHKESDTTEKALTHSLTHSHICRDEYMFNVSSHFGKGKLTKILSNEALNLFPVIFFFFGDSFLRQNLHTIQFTHLKCTVQLFSCSVMSSSSQPHGLQHARLLCSSLSPGACSDSCPLSQ